MKNLWKKVIVIVSSFLTLCFGYKPKNTCFEKLKVHIWAEVAANKEDAECMRFKQEMAEAVDLWVDTSPNSAYRKRKREVSYFVSDNVLLNSNRTKGIGFLVCPRKEGEILDFVDIIVGEKENQKWVFYDIAHGQSYDRGWDSIRTIPISVDTLQAKALESMIRTYYKNCEGDKNEDVFFDEFLKFKYAHKHGKPKD